MTRSYVMWPDKRLRTAASDVAEITDDIRAIWDEMIEAMDAMPGVGLAAVQIGVPLRLAVVDASDARGQAIRMANPEILFASAEMRTHQEASPNLPGVSAIVGRPRAVTVQFMDANGELVQRDLVGLWATSVQYQIDRLAGRMYFDHVSRTKRDMLIKKSAKLWG